jgi:hypothetical protein
MKSSTSNRNIIGFRGYKQEQNLFQERINKKNGDRRNALPETGHRILNNGSQT